MAAIAARPSSAPCERKYRKANREKVKERKRKYREANRADADASATLAMFAAAAELKNLNNKNK